MLEFFSTFFNNLISGVFFLVRQAVNIILTPFDFLISRYLPNVQNIITFIDDAIEELIDYVEFAISFLGLSDNTFFIIKTLVIYIITVPILAVGVKLAVKWYNALKVG